MKQELWPLSRLKAAKNVRSGVVDVTAMRASLDAVGQINPIEVTPDGSIITGHTRYAAMMLPPAWDKPVMVSVITKELDEADTKLRQLAENCARNDLSPQDFSRSVQSLRQAKPELTNAAIAGMIGKSPAIITQALAVGKLLPEPLAAFLEGKLSLDQAYSIAASHDQLVTFGLLTGGASREEVRRKSKPKKDAVRVSKIKIPLPSGHVVTVSGEESSLEDAVEALNEVIKRMKKAITEGISAKVFAATMKDKAAAG